MTHYYFDIKDGVTTRDHNGIELASDEDAIARGTYVAEELAAQSGRHHLKYVSIIREDGTEVTRVPIAAAQKKA